MWFDGGWQHIKCFHISVVAVQVVLYHLHRFELFEAGLFSDFVFAFIGVVFEVAHIGYVSYIPHLVAQMAQVAIQNIESDSRSGVSQMGITIDRWPADIHAHHPLVNGGEELLLTGEAVVYQQITVHRDISC